jgi:hypothetical protein
MTLIFEITGEHALRVESRKKPTAEFEGRALEGQAHDDV